MKNKILTLCTILCLFAVTNTASAALMNGSISFTGTAVTTSNGAATMITDIDFDTMYADLVTGSFSSIAVPAATAFTDLTPIVVPTLSLWSVGGFTFDLLNITTNMLFGTFALVSGTGIATHIGYDPTILNWAYSTQSVNGVMAQTFSASSVPAPAGIALLGLALLGFGVTRLNKKEQRKTI